MGNVSKIYIEVEVDGKGGIKVLRQIGTESDKTGKTGSKAFEKMDRSAENFNRQIQHAQNQMLKWGGILLGGYVIKSVAMDFLDVASSFEQMEVKLDALTRGRGPETLAAINQWALDMPVNTRKAVDTFAMMQAMGLDPTIAKMQTLVDVSSIFGEEAMPRVARALGQMITLGKLSSEELNQMAEAGINARKYLSQAFGMTVEELQKSKISIDQIVDAIWQGLNADFSGAAQKAQSSWQGIWTTFISYVQEAERQVADAGLFEELKIQMSGVNEELADWIKNNSALIAQKVPEYVGDLKTNISDLYALYQTIPSEIVGAAGYGIAGRVLFGGWGPAKVVAGLYLINEGMKKFDLDIGSSVKNVGELNSALQNIWDVITGKRDWDTGQLKGMAADLNNLRIAAEQTKKQMEELSSAGGKTPGNVPRPSSKIPYFDTTLSDIENLKQAEAELMKGYDTTLKASIDKTRPEYVDLWQAQANDRYEVQARGLERIIEAEEENNNRMIELSQRTAEAMEQNFSDLYFDIMRQKYRGLGDYADAVLMSMQRATADVLGQMTKEALFGGGSNAGASGNVWGWFSSLFSGGSNYAGAGTRGVTPGSVNWHAQGGTFGPDEWIGVGEKGPEIIYTGNKSGQVIPAGGAGNVSIQVNVINNGEPMEQAAPADVRFDGSKYIADVHIDRMINNRSYRQANKQAMR